MMRLQWRSNDVCHGNRKMIRYDLVCACGHRFDAWFSDSASYDEQVAAGLVTCPMCGDTSVRKQLMAPAVATSAPPRLGEETRPLRELVRALHAHLRRHADYVGRDFPDEVRRRARQPDARPVWGEASRRDVAELAEEGIEVLPLPPLPDKGN